MDLHYTLLLLKPFFSYHFNVFLTLFTLHSATIKTLKHLKGYFKHFTFTLHSATIKTIILFFFYCQ